MLLYMNKCLCFYLNFYYKNFLPISSKILSNLKKEMKKIVIKI